MSLLILSIKSFERNHNYTAVSNTVSNFCRNIVGTNTLKPMLSVFQREGPTRAVFRAGKEAAGKGSRTRR